MRLEIKVNWEKQTNKQTTTVTTKTKASKNKKRKTKKQKQNKKQKTVTTVKVIPSQPQPIFSKDLSQAICLFLYQKTLIKHYLSTLWNDVIYYEPFFVKAIVFIELVKAISFSIVFTFRISAMRLFKFMNFFSLDLNT